MDIKNTKILFAGTSHFAKEILVSLLEKRFKVSGIITQPDKKSGRERKIIKGPVKEMAEIRNIPFIQPEKLDKETILEINNFNPDLIVVADYGKIIPKKVLEIPKYKSMNVHPSLLPKFRGPSPIQNTLLSGEKETGVTIILMDEKMDHGDILAQKKIKINPEDNYRTLAGKLANFASDLLIETIPLWLEKKIKPLKQNDLEATYCQLIEREDGHIFWNEEAETIFNKYRAFDPWPGIYSVWEQAGNFIRIKINKIRIKEDDSENNHKIGEVIRLNDDIGIKTAKGIVILEEIQLQGKKAVKITDFINGYPNFVGSILK